MSSGKNIENQDASVRDRLLKAALTLFNEKGYSATSVREIVAASGVSKPVLYYYFGSKEGLYLELMNSSFAEFDAFLAQITTLSGAAAERIIHFCLTILDLVLARLEVLRLIYAIYYGPPQGAPHINFEDYFTRIVDTIRKLVEEGTSAGELQNNDSTDVAWIMASILSTAMEEQLCHNPPRIDRRQMERMLRLTLKALSNQQ